MAKKGKTAPKLAANTTSTTSVRTAASAADARALRVSALPDTRIARQESALGDIADKPHEVLCECVFCKNRRGFNMPAAIVEAIAEERLVIFAGAGVSTESPIVLPRSFYDDIRDELCLEAKIDMSFPELMSRYCSQPDGRIRLLRRIKERFDYLESFPELLRRASRFHQELATIPQINEIVTTNWDPYFEQYTAATPFVYPQDFSFWGVPGRKVFKIHGSVSSYGSIIATTEDYARCYKDIFNGIVGANLRMILATKTVLFVGYSLRDSDLVQTYEAIKGQMGNVLPQAYIITVDDRSAPRFKGMGLHPIVTDATYFLEILKANLISQGMMQPDSQFAGLNDEYQRVTKAHNDLTRHFDLKRRPVLLYTLCYQDGLMHGLERAAARALTGEYSRSGYVAEKCAYYEDLLNEKARHGIYHDVAYIEGYLESLYYLGAMTSRRGQAISRYYLSGNDEPIRTWRSFERALRRTKAKKQAINYAKRFVDRLAPGMVFHHLPIL